MRFCRCVVFVFWCVCVCVVCLCMCAGLWHLIRVLPLSFGRPYVRFPRSTLHAVVAFSARVKAIVDWCVGGTRGVYTKTCTPRRTFMWIKDLGKNENEGLTGYMMRSEVLLWVYECEFLCVRVCWMRSGTHDLLFELCVRVYASTRAWRLRLLPALSLSLSLGYIRYGGVEMAQFHFRLSVVENMCVSVFVRLCGCCVSFCHSAHSQTLYLVLDPLSSMTCWLVVVYDMFLLYAYACAVQFGVIHSQTMILWSGFFSLSRVCVFGGLWVCVCLLPSAPKHPCCCWMGFFDCRQRCQRECKVHTIGIHDDGDSD